MPAEARAAAAGEGGVLIVVEGRDQLYCIAVDQLIGKQEVVIKSLGKTYRDVPAILKPDRFWATDASD